MCGISSFRFFANLRREFAGARLTPPITSKELGKGEQGG
jgi:hypothetical protein